VDGANAARDFLKRHGITQADIDTVDGGRAAHDTRRSKHMHPVIALLTAGVEMDVRAAYQGHSVPNARRW
jgi:hypothetical protein